jgi:type IV pilus assembly protein PilQ
LALAQEDEGTASSREQASMASEVDALMRVDTLSVRGDATHADLVIRGEFDVPTYSVRSREQGRVVVIDVQQASMSDSGATLEGTAQLITRTTTSTHAGGVRIELEMQAPVSYRVRASAGRIHLRFELLPPESEESSEHALPVVDGATEREASSSSETPRTGAASVERITIERRDGRDRVVLTLSRGAEFRLVPGSAGPARLELSNTTIAPSARREVRSTDLSGTVRSARVRSSGSRAIVEVERAAGAIGTAIREGDRIVWLFAPAPSVRDRRPSVRTISRDETHTEALGEWSDTGANEIESEEVAAFLTDVPLQVEAARGSRSYRGRRIDLDFNNADIHNILRLLAEVGGVNIVTSDDVSGTVTIRMRNVPWDQALEVVLQAKGLGMVRRGNLIRVAPLSTLEKEREAAIARRKQQIELAPLETRLVPVSYATATELEPRVQELLSPRGTVSVDERTNVLIVRDMVEVLDDVEELVRTLDTQTPQVLVEARIVEATSQYVRDVGIQWGGDVTMSGATGNPTGLVFPSSVGVVGGNYTTGRSPTQGLSPFQGTIPTPNYAVDLPATTGLGQGGALGITLGALGGNVHLAVRLSAAEASGVIRIVSSPRILTLDNHEAHIAQGTLIPYSQISAQGVQTAFQEAKLELRVRPHVTSDGSVAMHVRITRDEPDFTRTGPRGDPTILKREAETDLLIDDGHTAVIGGIYTRTTGRNVDQIPFFGDIPILGVLFQRRRVRDDRGELLIFLTPRIVNRDEALRR